VAGDGVEAPALVARAGAMLFTMFTTSSTFDNKNEAFITRVNKKRQIMGRKYCIKEFDLFSI
jgi:hypothetical protein